MAIPIFLLLVFGVVEFARWLWFYSLSYTATREAARYGSSVGLNPDTNLTHEVDCVGIQNEAIRVGSYAGINTGSVGTIMEIRYDNGPADARDWSAKPLCGSGYDPVLGDRVLVRIALPFRPIFGIVPETNITNTAARTIIKDVDVGGTPGPLPPSPTPRITRTPTPEATPTVTPTPVDFKPYVISTIPQDDAINVFVDADLTVNFSESVTADGAWAALTCDGVPVDVVLSGADATYTINPISYMPAGKLCTATIYAANITDLDGTIDAMEADYTWTFTTKPDYPPTVISVVPVDGATNVSVFSIQTVRFSEVVTASGTWATLTCDGTPVAVTLSGSGDYYSITPNAPMPPGKLCTVTVLASKITDLDGTITQMENNYTWSFTTKPDLPPTVISTTPANSAVDVPVNTLLTVTFSEPVTAVGNWATLTCGSTSYALTLSGMGATYTITPAGDLIAGTVCTATVLAANISDLDGAVTQMAADYSWSFTLVPDEAPTVVSTSPFYYESNVPLNSDITVTFSEPVNVSSTWYSITCGLSDAHTATFTGGPTTFTINPDTDFYYGEQCLVMLENTLITDQDTNDPWDAMADDYILGFYTKTINWCDQIQYDSPVFNDKTYKYSIPLKNKFSLEPPLSARIVSLHVQWKDTKASLDLVTLDTNVWDGSDASGNLTITNWITDPVLNANMSSFKDLVLLFTSKKAEEELDTEMVIEFGNNPNYRCSIDPEQ